MVRKELRYKDQGVSTTAKVIQKERHYSAGRHGGSWHNTLKYRYQDSAGATFEGQDDVPLSVWEQSEEGQDLAIVYLRDEPSESRLPMAPFWHWIGFAGWLLFMFVFFAMACSYGWASERRRRSIVIQIPGTAALLALIGLTSAFWPPTLPENAARDWASALRAGWWCGWLFLLPCVPGCLLVALLIWWGERRPPFKLTRAMLGATVPEVVRVKLKPLIGQEFASRSAFLTTLAQHLDEEELRQFQYLLLSLSSRGMRSRVEV
jgi:hypothetical protein